MSNIIFSQLLWKNNYFCVSQRLHIQLQSRTVIVLSPPQFTVSTKYHFLTDKSAGWHTSLPIFFCMVVNCTRKTVFNICMIFILSRAPWELSSSSFQVDRNVRRKGIFCYFRHITTTSEQLPEDLHSGLLNVN